MDEQIRILCVDDEVNVLRALERVFLDDDYHILTASSAMEGFSILKEVSPIQIVVSDFRMPEMNGVEFLQEVRKEWPETVRIILSGFADTSSVVSAINESHIYRFIPKPWDDEVLRLSISNALEWYFLNRNQAEIVHALNMQIANLKQTNEALESMLRHDRSFLPNDGTNLAQSILGILPAGIVCMDKNNIIIYCNNTAAEFLSGETTDYLYRKTNEVLPPELCGFTEISHQGTPPSKKVAFRGEPYLVAVHKVPDLTVVVIMPCAEAKP